MLSPHPSEFSLNVASLHPHPSTSHTSSGSSHYGDLHLSFWFSVLSPASDTLDIFYSLLSQLGRRAQPKPTPWFSDCEPCSRSSFHCTQALPLWRRVTTWTPCRSSLMAHSIGRFLHIPCRPTSQPPPTSPSFPPCLWILTLLFCGFQVQAVRLDRILESIKFNPLFGHKRKLRPGAYSCSSLPPISGNLFSSLLCGVFVDRSIFFLCVGLK